MKLVKLINLNKELKIKYVEQNNNFNGVLKQFDEMSKKGELLTKKENELKKKRTRMKCLKTQRRFIN